MPILGVIASSIAKIGSFDSISTVTSTGSSGTITFSSIPSTYTHLQIRGIIASPSSNYSLIRFNSDTGSNYTAHFLYGSGSSAVASALTSQTAGYTTRADAGSPTFATGIIDILDYANTNKNKTFRTLTGWENNTTGIVMLNSGVWMSTSAITQIDLITQSGNYSSGTTFALYGIKGA
jgi:hypothetical protein